MDTDFFIKKCRRCSFVFVNPRFRSDLYDVVYNEAKVGQNQDKDWLPKNKLRKIYISLVLLWGGRA